LRIGGFLVVVVVVGLFEKKKKMMMLVEEDEDEKEETAQLKGIHIPMRVVTTAFPKMPRHATSRENARETEHAKASKQKRGPTFLEKRTNDAFPCRIHPYHLPNSSQIDKKRDETTNLLTHHHRSDTRILRDFTRVRIRPHRRSRDPGEYIFARCKLSHNNICLGLLLYEKRDYSVSFRLIRRMRRVKSMTTFVNSEINRLTALLTRNKKQIKHST